MGFMRFVLDKRAMFIFMSAALFIAGVFSFRSLPIEPYPNVSPLIVQVITQWPGRGAAEVEQQLTVPIEIAMAGVAGVDAIRSVSLFGLSMADYNAMLALILSGASASSAILVVRRANGF